MRFLALVIFITIVISPMSAYAQTNCYRTGVFTNCSNGTSSTDMGNFRFYNDGTSINRMGNFRFYSDGTSRSQIGNFGFYSDGGSSSRLGNQIYLRSPADKINRRTIDELFPYGR